MGASVRRRLVVSAAFVLVLVCGHGVLRAQGAATKPRQEYKVGLCLNWKTSMGKKQVKVLAEALRTLLEDEEDLLSEVNELQAQSPPYGPWPRAGLDNDVICYADIDFSGDEFTILMRFYYVREGRRIVLPDITTKGNGVGNLKKQLLKMFHENFPVEAIVSRKATNAINLNRGTNNAIAKNDRFILLKKTADWWQVFDALQFRIWVADDDYSVMTIPPKTSEDTRKRYAEEIENIQVDRQIAIRRSGDPRVWGPVYPKVTNTFRIVWDDKSPARGARLWYAIGGKGTDRAKLKWNRGPQMFRDTVPIELPAGVPVWIKAVVTGPKKPIESRDPVTMDRWEPRDEVATLTLPSSMQKVWVKVTPESVAQYVLRVDGKRKKLAMGKRNKDDDGEAPYVMLRWGSRRMEARASSFRMKQWFPWTQQVKIPLSPDTLTIAFQPDYKDLLLGKLRKYIQLKSGKTPDDRGWNEAAGPAQIRMLLVDAARIMEECPPLRHRQFLSIRYTVARALAGAGFNAHAVMAMLDYTAVRTRAGTGISIVTPTGFSNRSAKMPLVWLWDRYQEEAMTKIAQNQDVPLSDIRLSRGLTLRIPALGRRLPAGANQTVYECLLGYLFYKLASEHGSSGIGTTLDRCLCYIAAYNYLNQNSYPTLPGQPFLHETLNLYGHYYLYTILKEISPLLESLAKKWAADHTMYAALVKEAKTAPLDRRQANRLAQLHFKRWLITQFYKKCQPDERRRIKRNIKRIIDAIRLSDAYVQIGPQAKANIEKIYIEATRRGAGPD